MSQGSLRGYRKVYLRAGAKNRYVQVHVLVASAFLGPCPDGQEIDHRDHDRANNAATNLRYRPVVANRGDQRCTLCRRTGHKRVTCTAHDRRTDGLIDRIRPLIRRHSAAAALRDVLEQFPVRARGGVA